MPTYGGTGVPLIDMVQRMTGGNSAERFIEQELPGLVDAIRRSTNLADIKKNEMAFINRGLAVGIRPDQLDKLNALLVKPALQGVGADELGKLGAELRGGQIKPEMRSLTDIRMPEAGESLTGMTDTPAPVALADPTTRRTTLPRPFGQSDALRVAEIEARTGAKAPVSMASLLQTPSAVGENEAQTRAADALAKEREEQQRLISQKRTERALLEGEQGTVARADSPALSSFIDAERDRPSQERLRADQGFQARAAGTRSLADIGRINALRDRARQQPGLMGEFERLGGDPRDEAAFLDYVERRSTAGAAGRGGGESETTTETERVVDPAKQLMAERIIAKTATDRGTTKPEDLARIADDLGYELEGTPEIVTEGAGVMGTLTGGRMGDTTSKLGGNFRLRPKSTTRTTRKGAPGKPPAGGPTQEVKQLDAQTAAAILQEAGGDKNKARQLAKSRGYSF